MALPVEIDEYFLIGTILTFLMLNYNLNLSSVYSHMTIWLVLMYFIPYALRLFQWTPIIKKGKFAKGMLIGAGAGVAFIWLYSSYVGSTLGPTFATTAFGDSKFMGQLVFGILIPIIETVFFFRTIPQWISWKLGYNFQSVKPFSKVGFQLMTFGAAIFTIFHATAKGITNTPDLAASFLFAMISIGFILHFGQLLEGLVMHIVVNSKGVGLIDDIQAAGASGALISNPWFIAAVGGVGVWWLHKKGKIKIPMLA